MYGKKSTARNLFPVWGKPMSGTGDNYSLCGGKLISGTGDNYSLCGGKLISGTGDNYSLCGGNSFLEREITIPCVGETHFWNGR
jgi:hypothetical protein